MAKTPAKPKTPARQRTSNVDVVSAETQSTEFISAESGDSEGISQIEITTSEPVDADRGANSESVSNETKPDEKHESTGFVAPQSAPPQRASIFPMVLGGVLAGAIGFGAATYLSTETTTDYSALISAQDQTIAELRAALADKADVAAVSSVQGETDALTAKFESTLTDITSRLDVVERQPAADGSLTQTAVTALQGDLDDMRAQMAEMSAATMAQLETTRTEAAAIEESATATAQNAVARTAVARIQAALETGADLSEPLSDLASALAEPVPAALQDASVGVATLAQLQADFPDLARQALATARAEGAAGETEGGFTAFLRNQFDVRSVTPQEGDSADAVLSRAEASLLDGRLNDTLAEVAALPEIARAVLADWSSRAEARAAAISAANDLSNSLNAN